MARLDSVWATVKTVVKPLGKWSLLLGLVAVSAIAFAGCNPSQFTAAEVATSRIVFSSLGDPKTFNPALSQEYPNIFIYTSEGLLT